MIQFFNMMTSKTRYFAPAGVPSISIENTKIIKQHTTGNWYGRVSIARMPDNIIVMTYRHGPQHDKNNNGVIHIKFSDNFGDTWTDDDVDLNGNPVTGFPMTPSLPDSGFGPVHGLLILCQNGDLLCQMWNHKYTTPETWLGAYQSRSTDGGLTWSTPVGVTLSGTGVDDTNKLYIGEDHFVLGSDIYISVREYRPDLSYEQMFMFKSSDNGVTYQYVGQMTTPTSPSPDGSGEIGFTYIGNNKITGLCRVSNNTGIYRIDSDDMGLTWSNQDISSSNPTDMGRSIIKSRAFAKKQASWWNDPVLIGCGMIFPNGTSLPRRNSVFISKDFGANWYGPLYVDATNEDGGYGDWFYNEIKNEYVYVTYRSPTGLLDASVIQYNFKINWA